MTCTPTLFTISFPQTSLRARAELVLGHLRFCCPTPSILSEDGSHGTRQWGQARGTARGGSLRQTDTSSSL